MLRWAAGALLVIALGLVFGDVVTCFLGYMLGWIIASATYAAYR